MCIFEKIYKIFKFIQFRLIMFVGVSFFMDMSSSTCILVGCCWIVYLGRRGQLSLRFLQLIKQVDILILMAFLYHRRIKRKRNWWRKKENYYTCTDTPIAVMLVGAVMNYYSGWGWSFEAWFHSIDPGLSLALSLRLSSRHNYEKLKFYCIKIEVQL